METNHLITALAADLPTRPPQVSRTIAVDLAWSAPISIALFALLLGVRPDFVASFGDPRVVFKFLFTLMLGASGLWLAMRVSRPGTAPGPARLALMATGLILLVGVGLELAALPSGAWRSNLMGTNLVPCLLSIPMLAAAPLAALMLALRAGAPDHPAIAGAAAGLLAGAIGATLYASHCDNDSPLFVAVWYGVGIAAVTLVGSLVGSRLLRW
jgi:hypothetical protein